MQTTIKDPRIAHGFSALAKLFGGGQSAQELINADLAAHRRDLMMARAENEKTRNLERRNQMANTGIFQADIANMPELSQSPEGLAQIFSSVPGMGVDAMQVAPGFVTGVRASGADPALLSDPERLSLIMAGTGVSPYPNTPAGQQANHVNDQVLTQMGAQSALDQLDAQHSSRLALQDDEQAFRVAYPQLSQGGAGAPATASPTTVAKIWEAISLRLAEQFNTANVDPQLRSALTGRAVELYQVTKNAELAIQQALSEVPVLEQGQGWFDGKHRLELGDTLTTAPASADNPAAGGAPASAAGGSQDPYPEGTIIVNDQTGERLVRRAGQWVPVQ